MMEQRQGKRRGRPKSPPDTVRRLTIDVRVNSEEWRGLQRKAAFMGMPPARWLRIAALARRLPPPPVPESNRAIYSELARMGINLNQLTRTANEGRIEGLTLSLLSGVKQTLLTVQRAVLGQQHDRQADQG